MFKLKATPQKTTHRNLILVNQEGYFGDMDEIYADEDSFKVEAAEGVEGFETLTLPEELVFTVMCYLALIDTHAETIPELYAEMVKMFPDFDKDTPEWYCPIGVSYDILPSIETYDNNSNPFTINWEESA